MSNVILSPSLLAANTKYMDIELAVAERSGAAFIHVDIMDGLFVANKTWDASFLSSWSKKTKLLKDVHIMVVEPWKWIQPLARAGADIITFHLESCKDEKEVERTIDLIKKCNLKVGLAIKPDTPIHAIFPYLHKLDIILIMSVEPGRGGQSFMPRVLTKVRELRREIDEFTLGEKPLIEIDGGINRLTGRLAREAGADVLVAGSYLYGHPDFLERAEHLLKL